MNDKLKKEIFQKINNYHRIILTRHIRPDGDSSGSTLGLREILRLTFPGKEIYLINSDYSDYIAFLGEEDNDIPEELYKDALMITLDTATTERISNKKYSLVKELIKIDHHPDVCPYGDLRWVEDQCSSVCEMITDFYLTFREHLKINTYAATCLYTGLVTDSGRFRFSSTTGETLRRAAVLLDFGIDTDRLYAHLYLEEFDQLKFKAYVYKKMKITPNGVAYLHVDSAMQEKFSLTGEQAGNAVCMLESIKGCILWVVFIDNADGSIRVRLRSRFVKINSLAENYHGGGHAHACGATVHSKKEMKDLLSDADRLVDEYKTTHKEWL